MLTDGTLFLMRHVKENVAVALLIAALIIIAFWGIELHLLALMVVIAVIAYLAFVPALWEHHNRRKTEDDDNGDVPSDG